MSRPSRAFRGKRIRPLADALVLSWALLGLCSSGLFGCASTGGFAAATEIDAGRRRPDGVAIDPTSLPPPARDQAEATDGLVTLRAPLGVDRAILAVNELFRKIVLEDTEGLESLFTRDALALTTTAPNAGPAQSPQAALFWQQRFRRLDYTKLAGETVIRQAELEIYRAEDALETSPHPAIRLEALNDNDVVIRAPILTAHIGTDRLFGDEIIFWLRRDGDRYRIYRLLEDFQVN
jgi:hypothetical protein